VDEFARATYLICMAACVQVEAMAMQAENQANRDANEPPTYKPADFKALIERYGIHHNAVIGYLTGR
jgi:hypothetical protein